MDEYLSCLQCGNLFGETGKYLKLATMKIQINETSAVHVNFLGEHDIQKTLDITVLSVYSFEDYQLGVLGGWGGILYKLNSPVPISLSKVFPVCDVRRLFLD